MKLRSLATVLATLSLITPFVHAQEGEKKAEREPAKPQSAVASKTKTFATVAAGDGSVTKALKASDLDGLKKLLGKESAIEGTVVTVFAPKSNTVVMLNFDKDYKKAISVALRGRDFAAFPDLKTLEGKRVLVSGKIEEYKGRVEILLTKSDQIKLIK